MGLIHVTRGRVFLLVLVIIICFLVHKPAADLITFIGRLYGRHDSNWDTREGLCGARQARDGAFYCQEDLAKPDEDWENKLCPLKEMVLQRDFYDYINNPLLQCDSPVMLRGNKGVEEAVCAGRQVNLLPGHCVVYSFSRTNTWTFEDEVDRTLSCKVFSFSPSIGQRDHNRSANIRVFRLGISDVVDTGPEAEVEVDRYVNILQRLGHLNTAIDLLKLDVEGLELNFFHDVLTVTPNLLKNVKTLAVDLPILDTEPESEPYRRMLWKYFQFLDCFGFKIWRTTEVRRRRSSEGAGGRRDCCHQVMWMQARQW